VTKPFSSLKKYRILVNHGALVVVDGAFVPIAKVAFGTMSRTKRYALCRKWGAAVRCACGCGVWARLSDVDFDHVKEHVSGGLTAIANGAPLRRQPCHAAKSAVMAAVTGKVRKVRRKLTLGIARKPRRSWGSRGFDKRLRRKFDGTVEVRT
jgi:hypothetical protein